ncbi:MAG: hypothetical protein U0804_21545 [Gemmataceae bacterium]
MSSSVVTPAHRAEPAESSFLVGCSIGVVLGGALALPLCVWLLKL